MRKMVFGLLAVVAVSGCAAQAARDPTPVPGASASAAQASPPGSLDGSNWRFVEVDGSKVPDGVTATLHLHDGRASGKAGCNAYGASWETSPDGDTRFGPAMSTKMACLTPAGAMQVEKAVFQALQDTARVRRDGGRIVLLDAGGKPLATLAAAPTP